MRSRYNARGRTPKMGHEMRYENRMSIFASIANSYSLFVALLCILVYYM